MWEAAALVGLVLTIAGVAYFIGRHQGYAKGRVDEWFSMHQRVAARRRQVAEAYLKQKTGQKSA
jgi:hypothetical protein